MQQHCRRCCEDSTSSCSNYTTGSHCSGCIMEWEQQLAVPPLPEQAAVKIV
jgi:hypothetical protein